MKKLEDGSLVDLSPEIFDLETKTLHKKGLHIVCIPCRTYRVKSDGNINLRHKFCEYYFNQHYKTYNHKESILL